MKRRAASQVELETHNTIDAKETVHIPGRIGGMGYGELSRAR